MENLLKGINELMSKGMSLITIINITKDYWYKITKESK